MEEKESTLPEISPEVHPPKKTLRAALSWVLVGLVAFGLGALLILYLLYVPTRQNLSKTDADLKQANAAITEKTGQIATLEAEKQGLQKNLDAVTRHMALIKALAEVRAASQAVAANDYAGARLSLTEASATLDTLSTLLGADQKDVIAAMQKSAAQALADLKTDVKSAQPELDQLTKNLVQLEDSLFPNP